MKKIALQGDTTTHGGSLTGTGLPFSLDGRPSALCGEIFMCPDHEVQAITLTNSNLHVNGVPVALDGFTTTCGAIIIATGLSLADDGV